MEGGEEARFALSGFVSLEPWTRQAEDYYMGGTRTPAV